jgi:hypothetical protein
MVMQILVFVLSLAVAGLGWRWIASRKKPAKAMVAGKAASKTFHCVEVRKGSHACKAVQELGSTRFLSDEAPRLPVPGCTAGQCTCSFIHHDDRREDDRRNPYGQFANLPPLISGERRSRVERRKPQEGSFRPSIAS